MKKHQHQRRKVILFSIFIFNLICFGFDFASAKDIRYGGGFGFGGAGVKDTVLIEGNPTVVEKSEGPGVGSFFVENLLADDYILGLEYTVGFRLGPFSSGVSFLGATSKWYFFGPALFRSAKDETLSALYLKRYALFGGFGAGVAQSNLSRKGESFGAINASGFYFGPKFGVDYSYSKSVSFRYEFNYYSTFIASSPNAPTLTEFALLFGLVYFY